MGADVDWNNPEVMKQTEIWFRWYIKETHVDGLRVDAVKHIDFDAYRHLLKAAREENQDPLPAAEYWSGDVNRLNHYLEDDHIIGWGRKGDNDHPDSGLAVVMSDNGGGIRRMNIGKKFAGLTFHDALDQCTDPAVTDADGWGNFETSGGNAVVGGTSGSL